VNKGTSSLSSSGATKNSPTVKGEQAAAQEVLKEKGKFCKKSSRGEWEQRGGKYPSGSAETGEKEPSLGKR